MLNESWGKFRQMKQINIGIAGFGGRGSTVAREAFQVTGGLMRTVAVMEPSDAQYEATCATFGQRPARYRSVREMCEKEPIDVLLIGSPNGCHLENLREVAGLPIPVFMEKPIDASWEKIVEVMRLARRHPAPVLVGHCMRYAPILQQAKALLAQGAIGRIGSAHFIQYCHYGNGMYHTWRRESIGGGGMMLAFGIVTALLHASRTGEGQVIDCAMTDGSAALMALIWGARATWGWKDERGVNMLDTGAHFYETYETSDGLHVSFGPIEPQFYKTALGLLGLADDPDFAAQMDQARWPRLKEKLAEVFRTRTRDEWTVVFEGADACFAPILSLDEAYAHPHNVARRTFSEIEGVRQPSPAPRLSRTPAAAPQRPSAL